MSDNLLERLNRLAAGDHTVIPDNEEPTLWVRAQIALAVAALSPSASISSKELARDLEHAAALCDGVGAHGAAEVIRGNIDRRTRFEMKDEMAMRSASTRRETPKKVYHDVMLEGVLRMPYEMAMDGEMSRTQFYSRAQQALDELIALHEIHASCQKK